MDKKGRMILDIVMIVMMPLLMAYSLISETWHEIMGTAIFILFITHHILNRKWYSGINKGKYIAQRIFRTILDVLLFIFMFLQPISGILISKHLYTFLPVFPITSEMREIHLMESYWGFILLSIHAGIHLKPLVTKVSKSKALKCLLISVSLLSSIYGGYVFYKRDFWKYMTGKTAFVFIDFSESRIRFCLEFLSVMVLFAAFGYIVFNYTFGKKKEVQHE